MWGWIGSRCVLRFAEINLSGGPAWLVRVTENSSPLPIRAQTTIADRCWPTFADTSRSRLQLNIPPWPVCAASKHLGATHSCQLLRRPYNPSDCCGNRDDLLITMNDTERVKLQIVCYYMLRRRKDISPPNHNQLNYSHLKPRIFETIIPGWDPESAV